MCGLIWGNLLKKAPALIILQVSKSKASSFSRLFCLGEGIFIFSLLYMMWNPYIPLSFQRMIFPLACNNISDLHHRKLMSNHRRIYFVQWQLICCFSLTSHHAVVNTSHGKLLIEYRERRKLVHCARRLHGKQCWINTSNVKWSYFRFSVVIKIKDVGGREDLPTWIIMFSLATWRILHPWQKFLRKLSVE